MLYQDIPPIGEAADTLKQQRHPIKRQRLHMLCLLASDPGRYSPRSSAADSGVGQR